MTSPKEIGRKIAELRKKRGMTQEDLAGETELDRSYLSEIENGHKNISIDVLVRLAGALNVKPAKLLEE